MVGIEQSMKSEAEMEKHLEEKASDIERLVERNKPSTSSESETGVDVGEIIDKIAKLDAAK